VLSSRPRLSLGQQEIAFISPETQQRCAVPSAATDPLEIEG
jgi:hypothetical protein